MKEPRYGFLILVGAEEIACDDGESEVLFLV